MADDLRLSEMIDFMDPFCLLQLADDTNLLADSLESLRKKFLILFSYAKKKFKRINLKKTKFMHMSENPILNQIMLDSGELIDPVNPKEGYSFLGFKLTL